MFLTQYQRLAVLPEVNAGTHDFKLLVTYPPVNRYYIIQIARLESLWVVANPTED